MSTDLCDPLPITQKPPQKPEKPVPKPRRHPPVPPKPTCAVVKFRHQPPPERIAEKLIPSVTIGSTTTTPNVFYCQACSKRLLNTCSSLSCSMSYCRCNRIDESSKENCDGSKKMACDGDGTKKVGVDVDQILDSSGVLTQMEMNGKRMEEAGERIQPCGKPTQGGEPLEKPTTPPKPNFEAATSLSSSTAPTIPMTDLADPPTSESQTSTIANEMEPNPMNGLAEAGGSSEKKESIGLGTKEELISSPSLRHRSEQNGEKGEGEGLEVVEDRQNLLFSNKMEEQQEDKKGPDVPALAENGKNTDPSEKVVEEVHLVLDDSTSEHTNISLNSNTHLTPEKVEFRKNSLSTMERIIPIEYTSSPIAEILASSVIDEHPRPPSSSTDFLRVLQGSSNFMNLTQSPLKPLSPASKNSSRTSSASSNRGSDMVKHGLGSRSSRNSGSSSSGRTPELISMAGSPSRPLGVTLLEKIIRTHPIWYLQHIGRAASNHLLRPMPAGAFIVRASSRPSSMALTVRLPSGFDQDTDHYLIQRYGNGVRLEGSPNMFKSLPLLIEHYCKYGEELQTKLILPPAIASCKTTLQLQRIALMGQDFWTSEVGRMHISSSTSSKKLNRTPPMGTQMLNHPHMSQSTYSPGTGGTPRPKISKQHTIQIDDYYGTFGVANDAPMAMPPQHSFLKKSMSAHDGIRDPNGSLREKFDVSSGNQSVREKSSKTSRPVNFLRNLFSSQGSTESGNDTRDKHTMEPTSCGSLVTAYGGVPSLTGLAQCEYFTPFQNNKIAVSQSDASIWTNGSAPNAWSKKTDLRNSSTCKLHQEPSTTSESAASSLRRSFAKLKTFKPGGSKSEKTKNTQMPEPFQDDMSHKLTTDAIQARQMAFRREQTDLSNASVQRLIRHQHNESPHAHLRKPLKEFQHQFQKPSHPNPNPYQNQVENSKYRQGVPPGYPQRQGGYQQPGGPHPIVPPNGRKVMDSNTMLKCIEELRQKRMQSSIIPPPHPNFIQHDGAHGQSINGAAGNRSFEQYDIVLRSRQKGLRSDHNRLSVPNLNDLSQDRMKGHENQVANSVRALTAKLGRNPGTGELQTINEGLITPVIRRKQFSNSTRARMDHSDSETIEMYQDHTGMHQIPVEFQDISHQRTASSSSSRSAKSSNPGTSIGTQTLKIPINNTPSTSTGTPIHSGPPPGSSYSTSKLHHQNHPPQTNLQNWSAINSELKTRQRVAKVRPTPHTNPHTKTLSSSSSRLPSKLEAMRSSPSDDPPPTKKHSEYAQLSDFMEAKDHDNSSGSSFLDHSGHVEDDNVSVAGTVFNEPWDSNVWENLLDLAHYGDERPGTASSNSRNGAHPYPYPNETIEEEQADDEIVCTMEPHESDSEDPPQISPATTATNENEDAYGIFGHTAPRPRKASLSDSTSPKKPAFLTVENRCWKEVSQRIPSESSSKSSTFDPRKAKSNSLMNVAQATEMGNGNYSIGDSHSLQRRAFTPTVAHTVPLSNSIDDFPTVIPSLSPVISPPRLRNVQKNTDPARRIQQYVEKLSQDENTVFGSTLKRFIECTVEAEECDPHVVIRNVRQFLNGIKNYLVKHGEGDLHAIIEKESARLNSNEFLNIDAILEAILHKILLVPVKAHLYHLMVREHSKNGALQSLSENLSRVRAMTTEQLGFPDGTMKMQHHYSPLKKLESLLKALSFVVYPNSNNRRPVRNPSNASNNLRTNGKTTKKLPPVDELIRWLVYIMAKTSSVGCEVEAWYMWELLPQQLLTTGDAAYYLTTLFSAVHVLKNPDSLRRLKSGSAEGLAFSDPQSTFKNGSDEAPDAFIRVAVPDEAQGSIEYHMFPALPQMNAAKLCKIIAHQFAISSPEDYGLYILFDGFETCLLANEFPDVIRDQLNDAGKPHLFAYKRHEAKIAWPKSAVQVCSTTSSLDIHEQRARQQARAMNRTNAV